MPSKQVISANTAKQTQIVTESDGTVVETVTTTVTTTYADGSTGTNTTVETFTKSPSKKVLNPKDWKKSPGEKSGGATLISQVSPADSTIPKVENTTDPKFIQESLLQHNMLRAKHGSPDLKLNADLGKIAQAWANNLAKLGQMQHNNSGFGENVYWNMNTVDGKRPVDQWYSEIKDYNFKKLEGQKGTGHFTQVIWKSTQEVGIAMAKGDKGYFVVANYYPAGNFVGKYPANINPL